MALGKKTGGGSRKGKPNKATADVRAAIALLAARKVNQLESWLERVAKDDPGKAADIFLRAIEYHIPKLARTEHSGVGGGPIPVATATASISDEEAMRTYLKLVKG